MGKKLYVGNLPFSINDLELGSLFADMGTVVSAKVVTDRGTGRSKGFGFVEMSQDEEAAKAIEQYDGGELEGRVLKVSEARTPEKREPSSPEQSPAQGDGVTTVENAPASVDTPTENTA